MKETIRCLPLERYHAWVIAAPLYVFINCVKITQNQPISGTSKNHFRATRTKKAIYPLHSASLLLTVNRHDTWERLFRLRTLRSRNGRGLITLITRLMLAALLNGPHSRTVTMLHD